MSELIERARYFAIAAHAAIGQERKYTCEHYHVHCEEVANLVTSVPHTDEMVAAAWLHDVVEDTQVPLYLIGALFGSKIEGLVSDLTDVSKPQDGNRARRKAIDRAHTAAASRDAKTIKLADLISNSRSIVALDPDFARTYLKEKRLLLDEALTDGDPILWGMADEIVRTANS